MIKGGFILKINPLFLLKIMHLYHYNDIRVFDFCYNSVTRLREPTTENKAQNKNRVVTYHKKLKRRKPMKANFKNKTIEMTKREAMAAGRIGSAKFNELKSYQKAYPSFEIDIIATSKKKSAYKGLTYKFMETYIQNSKREDREAIMEDFKTLCGYTDDSIEKEDPASYLEVKEWFLKKFPEIEEHKKARQEKIEKILKSA